MVYPSIVTSVRASLKVPEFGGSILNTSLMTFQVYFILFRSSKLNNSSGPFEFAISVCSLLKNKNKNII